MKPITPPYKSLILFSLLGIFLSSTVFGNSKMEEQFLKVVRTAVDSKEEKQFWTLFNLEGVEEDIKAVIKKFVWKKLKTAKNLKLAFEPLPKDFKSEYVLDGIKYQPNLKPLGFVKFTYKRDKSSTDSGTSIPYGQRGNRYLFIGTVKQKLAGEFPPSKQIQVIIIGMGHPAVEFAGTMTYLQGNKPITEKIKDLGSGNLTRIVRGEAITHLEVRRRTFSSRTHPERSGGEVHRTSPNGTLKVIIMEDEETIFETKELDADRSIVFNR